jgi:hypothetical protein
MNDSAIAAQTEPEHEPAQAATSAEHPLPPLNWMIAGFFVLILALSALVALMILIAYQNGT